MEQLAEQEGSSLDIVCENMEALRAIFPEAFSEDGVNFDTLRHLLGEAVDEGEEKYGLNWHGRKKARQIALTPSPGTLRPCPDESVDWETTENLFIEGDNLEVLKLLQKSYAGKIKLIYIDPPYNTGRDFIYPDHFQDNLDTYLRYTRQKGEDGLKFSSNPEKSGRYHTSWLSMMYPRLKLAKSLLTKDGFIFISIDNHEVANLRFICSEIFGEENFRNMIVVRRGVKNVQSQFETISNLSSGHEYLLCYSADADVRFPKLSHDIEGSQAGKWDTFWRGTVRPTMRYELFGNTPETGQWRWSEDRTSEAIQNYERFSSEYSSQMALDDYFLEHLQSTNIKLNFVRLNENGVVQYYVPPRDYKLISDNWMDVSIKGNEIEFDTEKHTNYLSRIIKWITSEDDIILDFFAGSGTTGHAVWAVNSQDGGKRRHLLVQLPELIRKGSYKTIAEMAKDRLRKCAAEITTSDSDYDGDLGFKVFKLDRSNIRAWNPERGNLEQTLQEHVEHLVEGRSEEDVLYELLLKRGVELTVPIEQKEIEDKAVYSIGYGLLFACLDTSISREEVEPVAKGISNWQQDLKPESGTQVVFRDSAFADDIAKTNMTAILEQNGIAHVRSL